MPEGQRIQAAYDRGARGCFSFFWVFLIFNLLALAVAPHLEKAHPSRPAPMPVMSGHDYPTLAPKDGDAGRPSLTKRRDWESLQWVDMRALAAMPASDAEALLDEFGDFGHRGYQFEPYVGFAPYPCTGKELNVEQTEAEFPYRASVAPPHDGHHRTVVYTFGGSTTFGIYVSDRDTWTSALQTVEPDVEVTNFGRPYYYSTQEVALLQRLLKAGRHPDVVVFMDGLNDCFMPFWEARPDAPMFTTQMGDWIHRAQFGQDWLVQYRWVPIVRLAYALHTLLYRPAPAGGGPPTTGQVAERVLAGYRENVRIVRSLCAAYGVKCYFFWQPVPFYHYDLSLERRTFLIPPPMWEVFNKVYSKAATELPGVTFLGDALQSFDRATPAFVDNFHYSPAFNRALAGAVMRSISAALPAPGDTSRPQSRR